MTQPRMMRNRRVVKPVEPIAAVLIHGGADGFEVEVKKGPDLPEETLAGLLRTAADQLEGKSNDRAAGCWGR